VGRGSSTNQTNVIKHLENPRPTGGGQSGASESNTQNRCLFAFKITIQKTNTEQWNSFEVGTQAVIVINATDSERLDIFAGNQIVDQYSGHHKTTLRECLKQGYVYEGSITNVSKQNKLTKVTFKFSGYKMQ